MDFTRTQVVAARIHAQQLDRSHDASRDLTDAAVLDIGVQDTGRDGASWSLANRGVPIEHPADMESSGRFGLVWTLRGAPHFYRRAELFDVMTATSPFSEEDASKRVFGAGQPLREAGITVRAGLAEIARQQRLIVDTPRPKGEVSTLLSGRLPAPYLRECVPCQAVHSWENPFRFAALQAGLELEPGTSPPVLRRIPGWPRRPAGPATDPLAAAEHVQPIRAYLRLLGPGTPNEIARYLDATLADVKRCWPSDAREVRVEGRRAWILDEPQTDDPGPTFVRLLSPFDLLVQSRDRDLLVPDRTRHKLLWPTIGRPGAILVGTHVIGCWRPSAAGGRFTVRLDLWEKVALAVQTRIEEQAERLAYHRGLVPAGVEDM